MPTVIPNTQAVSQTVTLAAPVQVNGTFIHWPAKKIVKGIEVIHHLEYSISCQKSDKSTEPAKIKFTLHCDVGSGFEPVAGETASYSFGPDQYKRVKFNFKKYYQDGIIDFIPSYKVIAECTAGSVTLHYAAGRDATPCGIAKQQHEPFKNGGGGTEPPEEVLEFGYIAHESDTTNAPDATLLSPLYNAFGVALDDDILVSFTKGTVSTRYHSTIAKITVEKDEGDTYTLVENEDSQDWPTSSDSSLRYQDSIFLKGSADNRIFSSYGRYGAKIAWRYNPATRELVEIPNAWDFYPENVKGFGYGDEGVSEVWNGTKSAAIYVPSVDKVALTYQSYVTVPEEHYQGPFIVSATLTDAGFIPNARPAWSLYMDTNVPEPEASQDPTWTAAAAYGPTGNIVYALRLYRYPPNNDYRNAFISANVAGAVPVKNWEVDYTHAGMSGLVPVCVVGSSHSQQFIFIYASEDANEQYAVLIGSNGSKIGNPIMVNEPTSSDKTYGQAIWKIGTNDIIAVLPSNSQHKVVVLKADETGLTIVKSELFSGITWGMQDIRESTSMLIYTHLTSARNQVFVRSITWEEL